MQINKAVPDHYLYKFIISANTLSLLNNIPNAESTN